MENVGPQQVTVGRGQRLPIPATDGTALWKTVGRVRWVPAWAWTAAVLWGCVMALVPGSQLCPRTAVPGVGHKGLIVTTTSARAGNVSHPGYHRRGMGRPHWPAGRHSNPLLGLRAPVSWPHLLVAAAKGWSALWAGAGSPHTWASWASSRGLRGRALPPGLPPGVWLAAGMPVPGWVSLPTLRLDWRPTAPWQWRAVTPTLGRRNQRAEAARACCSRDSQLGPEVPLPAARHKPPAEQEALRAPPHA